MLPARCGSLSARGRQAVSCAELLLLVDCLCLVGCDALLWHDRGVIRVIQMVQICHFLHRTVELIIINCFEFLLLEVLVGHDIVVSAQ